MLVFLLLASGLDAVRIRRPARRWRWLLKTLAFVAIILALAEPKLTLPETKMAVAVLVDTSASVSPQDLRARLRAGRRLWRKRAAATGFAFCPLRAPFAISTPAEQERGWQLQYTAGEAGRATDLEAAISEAVTSLPSGLVPRLVLISDGKENTGSITRAAWQAQHLGIPIDTFAAGWPRRSPNLRLESVSLPTWHSPARSFPSI